MKKYLLLLLFCYFSARSQDFNMYENYKDFRGKVQSVEENYYTSLEHYRNRTYETLYKTLDFFKRIIVFDNSGRQILLKEYDTPNHCLIRTNFLYDEKSRPIGYKKFYDTQEISYRERDNYWTAIYSYPKENSTHLTKKEYALVYRGNLLQKHTTYTYNSSGDLSLAKVVHIDHNRGKVTSYTTLFSYTYDKQGLLTKVSEKAIPSGDVLWNETYIYDTQGKLKEKTLYWDNTSFLKYSYVYNEEGDICEEHREEGDVLENPKNNKSSVYCTYKYDAHNNWIEKVTSDKGNVFFVTERIITYD